MPAEKIRFSRKLPVVDEIVKNKEFNIHAVNTGKKNINNEILRYIADIDIIIPKSILRGRHEISECQGNC